MVVALPAEGVHGGRAGAGPCACRRRVRRAPGTAPGTAPARRARRPRRSRRTPPSAAAGGPRRWRRPRGCGPSRGPAARPGRPARWPGRLRAGGRASRRSVRPACSSWSPPWRLVSWTPAQLSHTGHHDRLPPHPELIAPPRPAEPTHTTAHAADSCRSPSLLRRRPAPALRPRRPTRPPAAGARACSGDRPRRRSRRACSRDGPRRRLPSEPAYAGARSGGPSLLMRPPAAQTPVQAAQATAAPPTLPPARSHAPRAADPSPLRRQPAPRGQLDPAQAATAGADPRPSPLTPPPAVPCSPSPSSSAAAASPLVRLFRSASSSVVPRPGRRPRRRAGRPT